ncbi:MAG: acyltransferase family protein [Gemmatimonadaceae bacterium]
MRSIDATRGLAMLFVCFSHFVDVVVAHRRSYVLFRALGMIASPAFMLISGMTLGYTARHSPATLHRFVSKLRERAVFLLTVVHALLVPSHLYAVGGLDRAARTIFITDTIAFALLVGPWIVARTGARARVLTAAALVAVSWAVILAAPPDAPLPLRVLQEALFGSAGDTWIPYNFPLIPWLGVYLLGTVIGESLPEPRAARGASRAPSAAGVLLRWSRLFLGGALAALAARVALPRVWPASRAGALHLLLTPFGKRPPSPGYMLMYGAIALGMAAVLTLAMDRGRLTWATDRLAEIGRSSVWIFVVQFYVYYFCGMRWPVRYEALWPAYFAASVVLIALAARAWLALGGNRLIRVPGWPAPRPAVGAGAP